LRSVGQWRGEIWNRRKDGEIYAEWLTISTVNDAAGQTTHYVAIFSDATQLKPSQERMDFLPNHDALTGLPNRILLQDRLSQAIRRAQRERGRLALLFVDLDRFKKVNDTLGHEVGDRLLEAVARRLGERLRGADTL
jgi:PleD family two-component response regulator